MKPKSIRTWLLMLLWRMLGVRSETREGAPEGEYWGVVYGPKSGWWIRVCQFVSGQ